MRPRAATFVFLAILGVSSCGRNKAPLLLGISDAAATSVDGGVDSLPDQTSSDSERDSSRPPDVLSVDASEDASDSNIPEDSKGDSTGSATLDAADRLDASRDVGSLGGAKNTGGNGGAAGAGGIATQSETGGNTGTGGVAGVGGSGNPPGAGGSTVQFDAGVDTAFDAQGLVDALPSSDLRDDGVSPTNLSDGGVDRASRPCVLPLSPRVMPLGDSITAGVGDFPHGGYRSYLYERHPEFRPVGSQSTPTLDLFPEKSSHEGHADGRTPSGVLKDIDAWWTANPADLVLLHIGTNQLINPKEIAAQVGAIIDFIHGRSPATTIMTALIINVDPTATELFSAWQEQRAAVEAEVPHHPGAIAVPMPFLSSQELVDGWHPTPDGYRKIAAAWAEAIDTNCYIGPP